MTDLASHSPLFGRSILVVDDVGVVRKAVFRFLSEAGARVFESASAGKALEVLSTSQSLARPALEPTPLSEPAVTPAIA